MEYNHLEHRGRKRMKVVNDSRLEYSWQQANTIQPLTTGKLLTVFPSQNFTYSEGMSGDAPPMPAHGKIKLPISIYQRSVSISIHNRD